MHTRAKLFFYLLFLIFVPASTRAQTTSITPAQSEKLSACIQRLNERLTAGEIKFKDIGSVTAVCFEQAGLKELYEAQTATEEEQRAATATAELWENNEALRINIPELHKKMTDTPLSVAESQKIAACMEDLAPSLEKSAGAAPDPATSRAIAGCFQGTAYESIVSPVYEKIAVVIECGRDKLGEDRVAEMTDQTLILTDRDVAIITKCYLERTAPVVTAIGAVNVIAVGGVRTVLLFGYLGISNVWAMVRRRRGVREARVMNVLRNVPVDLAIVRLLDPATGATKRTIVSDTAGSCYLFAPSGSYTIEVKKPGFIFPAVHLPTPDPTIGIQVVVSEQDPVVRGMLGVEEQVADVSVRREQLRRWGHRVANVIVFAAPLVGVVIAILSPQPWIIALTALNVIFAVVSYALAARVKPKAYGVIRNSSGVAVAQCIVRLFDLQYNKLLAAVVTDNRGRYGFSAGVGTYELRAEKKGDGAHVQRVAVSANDGVVAQDMVLTPAA